MSERIKQPDRAPAGARICRHRLVLRLALVLAGLPLALLIAWLAAASATEAIGPQSARFDVTCLPTEHKELLLRVNGRGQDAPVCELPCLERPQLDSDDARRIERKYAITWCKTCEPAGLEPTPRLPRSIIDQERSSGATLCPSHAGLPAAAMRPMVLLQEDLRGIRELFSRRGPAALHENLAVVLALPPPVAKPGEKPAAIRDATAMAVLLTERLGYRARNMFELRNPSRSDIDALLGDGMKEKGTLAQRIASSPNATIFVYVSGQGMIDSEAGASQQAAILTAAPGQPRSSDNTVPVEQIYQRLADMKAASVTVVLDVSFRSKPPAGIEARLNLPDTEGSTLPATVRRGFVAMTAAERNQRTLVDPTTGLSLFTRYLVEGLSGEADARPFGNGDGGVDTTEAFIYAASRTGYVARKLYGIVQRPQLSAVRPILLTGRPAEAMGRSP